MLPRELPSKHRQSSTRAEFHYSSDCSKASIALLVSRLFGQLEILQAIVVLIGNIILNQLFIYRDLILQADGLSKLSNLVL